MDNVVYLAFLFCLVFITMRWKSFKSLRSCHYSKASSSVSSNSEKTEDVTDSKKNNIEDYGDRILENIGYFVASNDEKKSPKYYPTSLQDIDPSGLA